MVTSPKLLLKNTPEDVLLIPFSDVSTWQELLLKINNPSNYPAYTVWITQIEQIHQFVRQVPDLAWELMDYATEPLSIIYNNAKPLTREAEPPNEICIRLIVQPKILQLLSVKHPWISIRLTDLPNSFSTKAWASKELDLKDKNVLLQRLKIMRVFDNGRFAFLP